MEWFRVDETLILEIIFVTLSENSSVVTSDTQKTQNIHTTKYSFKNTLSHTKCHQNYPKVFSPTEGGVSLLLLRNLVSLLSCDTV